MIVLSCWINWFDGMFVGIVVGMFSIDYFCVLFDGFVVGWYGSVVIVEDNGMFVLCLLYDMWVVGFDLYDLLLFVDVQCSCDGELSGVGVIDGVWCVYVYKYFVGLLLIVDVVFVEIDIYVLWQYCVVWIVVLMSLFMVFIVWGLFVLLCELKCWQDVELKLYWFVYIDLLMGFDNCGMFDVVFVKEVQCVLCSGCLLFVLFVDVDYFKVFNDYYGYLVGDDVLCQVV